MTSESIKLLNQVKDLLVGFANQNNIRLTDDFATVDDFKDFVIAFTFKALIDQGIETSKAFDLVLGAGSYEKLTTEIWANAQVQ